MGVGPRKHHTMTSPEVIVGSAFYIAIIVLGFLFALALILAPLKLYAIHRELQWQSEELRTQTRLLASLANSPAADIPPEAAPTNPPRKSGFWKDETTT